MIDTLFDVVLASFLFLIGIKRAIFSRILSGNLEKENCEY